MIRNRKLSKDEGGSKRANGGQGQAAEGRENDRVQQRDCQ